MALYWLARKTCQKKNYAKQVGNQFGVQRKVSAANMDCNVVKILCGSTGMEPGFVPKIHFARYDRRELDTNYRARGWKQPFGFSERFPAGMEVLTHLDYCLLSFI